jgi:hypothetical protein
MPTDNRETCWKIHMLVELLLQRVLIIRKFVLRKFSHTPGCPLIWTRTSHKKSLPNKTERLQAKTGTKERNIAHSDRLTLSSATYLKKDLVVSFKNFRKFVLLFHCITRSSMNIALPNRFTKIYTSLVQKNRVIPFLVVLGWSPSCNIVPIGNSDSEWERKVLFRKFLQNAMISNSEDCL